MTNVSAPVLQGATGGSGQISIQGYGGIAGWRIDVCQAGTGAYLGAGPVNSDGTFAFAANYKILLDEELKGTYQVQVRQTDNTTTSYWSEKLYVTVT